jgi:cyclase
MAVKPNERSPSMPESRHFVFEQVADGVFAAIARDGGWAIANAGIVDLGGLTVLYDTSLNPRAALDLRSLAEAATGRPPDLVVNSHYHNDHIWGNQVFGPVHILATNRTRELILTDGQTELRDCRADAPDRVAKLTEEYAAAETEAERRALRLWIGYWEGLVQELPQLTVCLPDITFETRLTLHGERRSLELIEFKDAHTGSDAALYVRDAGVVFASDLLFVDCHPYLSDGDPHRLLKALQSLVALDAAVYVPGHGPAGRRVDLRLNAAYVADCLDAARALIRSGSANAASIRKLAIPARYEGWALRQFYAGNIQWLCRRLGQVWLDEAEQSALFGS